MIFLRTSLVWLLSAWVASGPSALILHHQFAHAGGASSCCVEGSSATPVAAAMACCGTDHKPLCRLSERTRPGLPPADSDTAIQQQPGQGLEWTGQACEHPGQSRATGEDSSPAGPCQVCEWLLHHHHVIPADVCTFAVSDIPLSLGGEADECSPFQRRLRNENLRGPPNC